MDKGKRDDGEDNRTEGRRPDSEPRGLETGRAKIDGTWIELDKWQKEVLKTEGNILVVSGRQVGKSTVTAIKAAEGAMNNPKFSVMIISAVERQAHLLFTKVLGYLLDNYKKYIKKGKDRPTKSQLKLTNGSIIRCLPTGLDGIGIRGYTVDLLIADEAAFIPEDVWAAVIPMLATTGGSTWLLSTPKGRVGHFFKCYERGTYTNFKVSSEAVAKSRKEPQRTLILQHQKEKEQEMSKLQYAQEYKGDFIDDLVQFFSDDLIRKCMAAKRRGKILRGREYYLGVDIARMGEDESTFEILDKVGDHLTQVENQVTTKTLLTQTAQHIIALEDQWEFKKIYVDDEGIGIGVFDMLITNDQTKRKTIALRNSQKVIDYKSDKKSRLLKEDLYWNLLRLMEQNKITLLDDPEIFLSLKSVQYENTLDKKGRAFMHIFGNNTHIAEGLIRAAWAAKEKNLSIWIDSI